MTLRKLIAHASLYLVGNRACKGIRHSRQMRYYKELCRRQWTSLEENRRIQAERLYEMVCFSLKHVPYYRDLGLRAEDFSRETIFEDIQKFPVLTKEIIRREGERMHPDIKLNDWVFEATSGGTTGAPLPFRHSGAFFDAEQGAKLVYDEWGGRRIGDSQVRLWGSERDIISGKKDWMNKLYRWTRNESFLNTFVMDVARMEEYIRIINTRKPRMILAYVQSAREMANYLREHSRKIHAPNAIMTTSGTLTPELHDYIRDTFHCPVLNRYGTREMGDMACSCDKNEGLHINILGCFLEVLDDANFRCSPEVSGNIVATSLLEYAMPLIRYEIGDRGALTDHVCSCGRGLPLLKEVTGRIIDWFVGSDGRIVYGDFFTHLFYTAQNVKQFQVLQETEGEIFIKLVLNDPALDMEAFYQDYTRQVRKTMGDIGVHFSIVEDIPVEPSGKRAYTISKISRAAHRGGLRACEQKDQKPAP